MSTASSVPGYAQLRLFWRPAALAALFPIGAVIVAGLDVDNALWRECIALPALIAFGTAYATRDALQSRMSWMLPRYRIQILSSTLWIAVLCALVAALITTRILSLADGVPAFGVAMAAFGFAWRATDPAASTGLKWAVQLLGAVVLIRPEYVSDAARAQPLTIAVLGGVCGAAVIWFSMTPNAVRVTALRQKKMAGFNTWRPAREAWERTPWRIWGRQLSPHSLAGLIHAGIYESPGVGGLSGFQVNLLLLGWISATGWVARSSSMVIALPLLFQATNGTQLKNIVSYPLSRRRMADSFFLASLLDAVTITAMSACTVGLLYHFGWWQQDPIIKRETSTLANLLFLLLLLPLLQAIRARGPLVWTRTRKPKTGQLIAVFLVLLPWMVGARLAEKLFERLFPGRLLGLSVLAYLACLLAIQMVFWLSLRSYFAKRDLA